MRTLIGILGGIGLIIAIAGLAAMIAAPAIVVIGWVDGILGYILGSLLSICCASVLASGFIKHTATDTAIKLKEAGILDKDEAKKIVSYLWKLTEEE